MQGVPSVWHSWWRLDPARALRIRMSDLHGGSSLGVSPPCGVVTLLLEVWLSCLFRPPTFLCHWCPSVRPSRLAQAAVGPPSTATLCHHARPRARKLLRAPEQPPARSFLTALRSVMMATVSTARTCRNTLCEFQIKKNMPSTGGGQQGDLTRLSATYLCCFAEK